MKVVHIAIPQTDQPKKAKLSNDMNAIREGLRAWKLKHNARLEKQQAKNN